MQKAILEDDELPINNPELKGCHWGDITRKMSLCVRRISPSKVLRKHGRWGKKVGGRCNESELSQEPGEQARFVV